MGANVFPDTRSSSCFSASLPEHFGCNRLIRSPVVYRARKQIRLGAHPAPVLAQSLQQFRTEWHISITVPLAMPDMDEHARAVDVGNLEVAQFRPAHSSGVQRHQHGAMEQITG